MSPKPVTQCQNRINFVESYGNNSNDMILLAMVEITYPRIRHGWHLAVIRVPLDGTATLKYTDISQDDISQVGPKGVWCLVTPEGVLHADEVEGSYQKFIDEGALKYVEQIYDKNEDTPCML